MALVAFATYEESNGFVDDDELSAEILRSKGIEVRSVVWDDSTVDWSDFSCVIIRSTWDYQHKPSQFVDWLRSVDANTMLWNPLELVETNMNKKYLLQLADDGLDVVPSVFLKMASERHLRDVLESVGWSEAVVKPAISASACGTWRTSIHTANKDQDKFKTQLCSMDLIVQPFVLEVVSDGEWSMVFFDGEYSHAAFKQPAKGDFRVQEHYGGFAKPRRPTENIVNQAAGIIDKLALVPLYARIDGVERDGNFILMELELIEPFLFLGCSPVAPSNFAAAIEAKL